MSHTYSITEIVGTSPHGVDDAIRSAVETASKTLRHLEWFEVRETRGHIIDSKVAHFQVTMRLGFRYDK